MTTDPMQRAASRPGRGSPKHRQTTDKSPDTTSPDLFSVANDDGLRLRDDGMRAALHASDSRWKVAAEDALADLIASGLEFTADDLRARVGVLASSPNALGALIAKAARRDQIAPTGVTTSTRPERHGGLLRTWKGAR
jgi:hypothetical protein